MSDCFNLFIFFVERLNSQAWSRESSCNFKTYLHNGDPLGKPTTHVPKGKNFTKFTDAAVDALKSIFAPQCPMGSTIFTPSFSQYAYKCRLIFQFP